VITPDTDTTTITTVMAGFNYVNFVIEIAGDQKEVEGGRVVFAKVFDSDCELLLHKRRMVFLKDTPPEKKVKTMHTGQQLRVWGCPGSISRWSPGGRVARRIKFPRSRIVRRSIRTCSAGACPTKCLLSVSPGPRTALNREATKGWKPNVQSRVGEVGTPLGSRDPSRRDDQLRDLQDVGARGFT
jgi:hypothetical protein